MKVRGAETRVGGEDKVKLQIEPKGQAKEKLDKKGKATVKAKVTYTPEGGAPYTESRKINLVKR